ncbi:MAG: PA14 domain-containing protein, partial [Chloroflexi bacterium]|nr:PA14 domain-containing protein [Chloroflexota bacterium]
MAIRSYPYRAKLIAAFALIFLLALGFMPAALLPDVVAQTGNSDPTWQATYWNNVTLTGAPVLQQSETDLNYDWGAGSPDARVRSDRFSARWTRTIYLDAGSYRFDATSDDGVRVYVDNVRIINAWFNHGAQTFSATRNLAAGYHQLTVYYYDNTGPALVNLVWSQLANPGGGTGNGQAWRAEYYNNRDLTGAPVLVRNEGRPDLDWGNNSPAAGVNADNFSARWTQALKLPAGNYRFRVTVDDGARLWVDNQLLIDAWRVQAPTTYTGDITLAGGAVAVRLEYFDSSGAASVHLDWARSDQAQPTPTNTPPVSIANWRGEYYNNRDLNGAPALGRDDAEIKFDWGNNSPAGGINNDNFSARWTRSLDLAAGRYRFHVTVD